MCTVVKHLEKLALLRQAIIQEGTVHTDVLTKWKQRKKRLYHVTHTLTLGKRNTKT